MIPMIFIGIIMYYLGILQGWLLFWYIVSVMFIAFIKMLKALLFIDYMAVVRRDIDGMD
jgi:hypothetical protein